MALHGFSQDVARRHRPGARRAAHPLALAWFGAVALLLGLLLAVVLFGRAAPAAASRIEVELDRPPAAPPLAAKAPAPVPPAALPLGVPPPPLPLKPVFAGRALLADPALLEQTPEGPLPRIAQDGRTPLRAYAPAVAAARGKKIAIVISGLGLDARATKAAIDHLPAAVTLAFVPYGSELARWVHDARQRGHEVLLEVPMEPADFPHSDPGPHSLRTTLSEDNNLARLRWALSRVTGYVGITNLMGGQFLANSAASEPVLSFLTRRGLMFFDRAHPSAVAALAAQLKTPYLGSSVRLDSVPAPAQVDQRLSELETLARTKGAAAGTGFLYPVTLARVAAWAHGLRGRGFVLVPASSIVAPNP